MDGSLQRVRLCGREGDWFCPCLKRVGEAKDETLVQERFARGGAKGDVSNIADDALGRPWGWRRL